MLGKEAMFMFELRAARGDMEGEEGVSSIRWASGLLGGKRDYFCCCCFLLSLPRKVR